MRVLVTGSRYWNNREAIHKALWWLRNDANNVTVVHGGASGADSLAAEEALEFGYLVVKYAANWHKFKRAAGPIRNQAMVDSGADVVLAFHEDITASKGTKNCVKKAKKVHIPVFIWPATDDWYAQWKFKQMKPLFPEK